MDSVGEGGAMQSLLDQLEPVEFHLWTAVHPPLAMRGQTLLLLDLNSTVQMRETSDPSGWIGPAGLLLKLIITEIGYETLTKNTIHLEQYILIHQHSICFQLP